MPIGRGDVDGVGTGFAKLDEPGPAGVEARGSRREMIGRDCSQTRDALSARRKRVAKLARHGDHVTIGAAQLSVKRIERGVQTVESQPKRRRRLDHRFDAARASRERLSDARPLYPNR